MTTLKVGDKAPDFTLPRDGGTSLSLSDYKGQKVILYFYPKDDTSGCTKEACSFNENLKPLEKLNAAVIGISKDSVKSHEKFKEKYGLTFPLVSDENDTVCEQYGTWAQKSMYGRKYMGIERVTFLIDENGVIAQIWPKVKVEGHTEEIIAAINQAKAA